MPSIAREHAEWLRLVESSGPFVSIPTLLKVFPQGLNTVDTALVGDLRSAHEEWEASQEGRQPDAALHVAWTRFTLERLLGLPADLLREGPALPPHLRAPLPEHGETLTPDLALVSPDDRGGASNVRLLVKRYPAAQDLERAIPGMRWNASPSARMAELLRGSGVALGLVTNGEQWMLVNALPDLTAGFASWYATLWLEEPTTLHAFCSLLGVGRFFGVPDNETLSALIAESAANQQEVTDQLGYQVRNAVEVLIQAIDRVDKDRGRALLANQQPEDLYNAALTVMMRLVFLFCAEERGLLLLGEDVYDRNYAVSPLGMQLRASADQHGEEVLGYTTDAWARLLATFRAVYGGVRHEAMTLPAYGGHLFDPDRYPFLEGRAAGTRWRETPAEPLPIDNRTVLHLLEALQLLQVRLPGGGPAELQRLSFRALDIEQIGHVYEGLLDHTARCADTPVLGLDGARDAVAETPLAEIEAAAAKGEAALVAALKERMRRSESYIRKRLARSLDAREQQRLLAACDNDAALYARVLPYAALLRADFSSYPVVYTPGSVYVTAGADRRSTGTHYTPRSLTEPIVQHTLDPLCYLGPAEGKPREEWRLRPAAELLNLKICDIAMGSGAFLVQAARYLSERLLEAWADAEVAFRAQGVALPVQITPEGTLSEHPATDTVLEAEPEGRRAQALRIVCDRCLYGVDKNAMAVEMAKLSLWLITLDKGRPFTFLDHALRCGDSLLGVADVKQLQYWTLSLDHKDQQSVAWLTQPINRAMADALRLRREIEAHPVISVADLEEKERLLLYAQRAMNLLRLGADLLVGAALAPDTRSREQARKGALGAYAIYMAVVEDQRDLRERGATIIPSERAKTDELLADLRARADTLLGGRRPFHWPLEFPEVFSGGLLATVKFDASKPLPTFETVAFSGPGFAAIVGNPPFMGGQKLTGALGTDYREYLVEQLGRGQRGSADLCAYFFLRVGQLLCSGGDAGLLATNTIAQGDTREVGLDQLVGSGVTIPRAVPSHEWPGNAAVHVAYVWLRRGLWRGAYTLDGQLTPGITAFLTPPGGADSKPYQLAANAEESFVGSIVLGTGFILDTEEAQRLIHIDPRNRDVIFPYLTGEDLNSRPDQSPSRWVINFHDWPLARAEAYPECIDIVRRKVKPERDRNKREPRRRLWWQYAEKAPALYAAIEGMERVLFHGFITKYLSFGFAPSGIVYAGPNNVIALDGFQHFALLQATIHEVWTRASGSTMGEGMRYTTSDCFATFPFPDSISTLGGIGERYYALRQSIMLARQEGLTKTYNRFHNPQEAAEDIQQLRTLHLEMDEAVAAAYGWGDLALGHGFHQTKQGLRYTISEAARREVLGRLLRLNHERHAEEVAAGLVDERGKRLKRRPHLLAPSPARRGGIAEAPAKYRAGRLFGEEG